MSLKERLVQEIKLEGPLSLSYFMQCCLSDSKYGYYQKQNPFGESGDFITSPEISQIFGEIIALYCIYQYQQIGSPNEFQVVELGPGNGSLMHDFLRTSQKFPDFFSKISVCLIEISTRLQDIQKNKLKMFGVPVTHYQSCSDIPQKQSFIIANEFFDALPIIQFELKDATWYERKIDYKEKEFIFCLVPTMQSANYSRQFLQDAQVTNGDIFELSPPTIAIFSDICSFIAKTKSRSLIIDYGYADLDFKPTLQALKKHQHHNIFDNLGTSDLTAHVNFNMLKKIAKDNMLNSKLITQKIFLESLGIKQRANMLKKNKDYITINKIEKSVERLTSTTQMGELFKILEIF